MDSDSAICRGEIEEIAFAPLVAAREFYERER